MFQMAKLHNILLFFIILSVVFAQDMQTKNSSNNTSNNLSREPESCRIGDKVLRHGDEWTDPRGCVVFFCYEGELLDVDYCADLIMNQPNCYIVPINRNVDFPYCCPKVVCN
uniref:Putative secreted protein n=1 Tax=Nyssomyia neivai TaxID=330878 RepID=A0A1L8DNR6_9DIPT